MTNQKIKGLFLCKHKTTGMKDLHNQAGTEPWKHLNNAEIIKDRRVKHAAFQLHDV